MLPDLVPNIAGWLYIPAYTDVTEHMVMTHFVVYFSVSLRSIQKYFNL